MDEAADRKPQEPNVATEREITVKVFADSQTGWVSGNLNYVYARFLLSFVVKVMF